VHQSTDAGESAKTGSESQTISFIDSYYRLRGVKAAEESDDCEPRKRKIRKKLAGKQHRSNKLHVEKVYSSLEN
jgi:hypothetical protein